MSASPTNQADDHSESEPEQEVWCMKTKTMCWNKPNSRGELQIQAIILCWVVTTNDVEKL